MPALFGSKALKEAPPSDWEGVPLMGMVPVGGQETARGGVNNLHMDQGSSSRGQPGLTTDNFLENVFGAATALCTVLGRALLYGALLL